MNNFSRVISGMVLLVALLTTSITHAQTYLNADFANDPALSFFDLPTNEDTIRSVMDTADYERLGWQNNLTSGRRLADNFIVDESCGWTVNLFTFIAYTEGDDTASAINHVNFRIWDQVPNAAGTGIIYDNGGANELDSVVLAVGSGHIAGQQLNGAPENQPPYPPVYRVTDTSRSDTNRILFNLICGLDEPIFFPEGEYWIDWQIGTDGSEVGFDGSSVPGFDFAFVQGFTAGPYDTNALEFDGTVWDTIVDKGKGIDFPFILLFDPSFITELAVDTIVVVADEGNNSLCNNIEIRGEVDPFNGETFTYEWTADNGSFDDASLACPIYTTDAGGRVYLKVTDDAGCESFDTLFVEVNQCNLSVNAGLDQTVCGGSCAIIGNPAGGGTEPISYTWSPVNGMAPGDEQTATPEVCLPVGDSDEYTVVVTDAAGCSARDSVTVISADGVEVSLQSPEEDDIFCQNDSETRYFATPVGGTFTSGSLVLPIIDRDDKVTDGEDLPLNIGNTGVDTASMNVTLTGAGGLVLGETLGADAIVTDICIELSHNDLSSVRLVLENPGGNQVVLLDSNQACAGVTNMDACFTTFNSNSVADECINNTPSTITGTFGAADGQDLNVLNDGSSSAGEWKLFLFDADSGSTNAVINNLSITLASSYMVIRPEDQSVGSHELKYDFADENGSCTGSTTVDIEINEVPLVFAGLDTSICRGGIATIGGDPCATDGQPPYSFIWNSDDDEDYESFIDVEDSSACPALVSPDGDFAYTLTVTDANGCESDPDFSGAGDNEINVSVLRAIVEDGAESVFVCEESCITFEDPAQGGLPPYEYLWEPVATFGVSSTTAEPTVCPDISDIYTLTLSDARGCVDKVEFELILNSTPIVDVGQDTFSCQGDTVLVGGNPTANSGTPPYEYEWLPEIDIDEDDEPNTFVFPTSDICYTLSVEDDNGCIGRDTICIDVSFNPIVEAGDNTFSCNGVTPRLGGQPTAFGLEPFEYRWRPLDGLSSTISPNPLAFPENSTEYTLEVTDSVGCVGTDVVFITAIGNIARAGSDREICDGASTVIGDSNAVGIGGFEPYSYSWSPSESLDESSKDNPTATPDLNTVYTITVSDDKGCIGVDSLKVRVNPLPIANAGSNKDICENECVRIGGTVNSPTGTGGTPSYQYDWQPSSALGSSNVLANPDACPTRTTVFTLTLTDFKGCTDVDVVTVTVSDAPIVNAGGDKIICFGDSIVLGSDPIVTGAEGPFEFTWQPGNIKIPRPEVSPQSNTTYTLTVRDGKGCEGVGISFIEISPFLIANAGSDIEYCFGESDTLGNGSTTASGGIAPYNYAWRPLNGLDLTIANRPITFAETDITYTLEVTDSVGCRATSMVTVMVNELPIASAGKDAVICRNFETQIGGNPSAKEGRAPYNYQWTPVDGGGFVFAADSTKPNPTVAPSASLTNYTLVVTDANGCSDSDVSAVRVLRTPEVKFEFETSELFVQFTDLSLFADEWEWSFGDGRVTGEQNPAHVYAQDGSYEVVLRAYSADNCEDTLSKQVNVAVTPTAVKNLANDGFKVYPNPTTGLVQVELADAFIWSETDLNMSVYDIAGNRVQTRVERQQNKWVFDLNNEADGLYFIRIENESNMAIVRIQKLGGQ